MHLDEPGTMTPEAQQVWAGLQFRMPLLLRNVEPLTVEQLHWVPGPGRNSIAWQLWHIAEVEDNWIRTLVTGEPTRFPFGMQLRVASPDRYPTKVQLIDYLHDVRAVSRARLERATTAEFERTVTDPDYGPITVRGVWAGVVTSFAWHAGQVALTAKLIPETPVATMHFNFWRDA